MECGQLSKIKTRLGQKIYTYSGEFRLSPNVVRSLWN